MCLGSLLLRRSTVAQVELLCTNSTAIAYVMHLGLKVDWFVVQGRAGKPASRTFMCFPPGRSGPQNNDVSVGTMYTLLLDPFQRPRATESSITNGDSFQARRHDWASAPVVTRDLLQCQLLACARR
jgi:hypothetical protein